MNKIVKEQLRLCKVADIPSFDDNTTTIHISKKSSSNGVAIREGHCYFIELSKYLLVPNDGFNFHQNWNNNVLPTYSRYKCECTKILGKVIKIYGVGYNTETNSDTTDTWTGWLPLEGITVISEL